MTDDAPSPEAGVDRLADVPLCLGCGLMGKLIGGADICPECFHRRERWCGGGPLRVVTRHGDHYHETPLCPAVRGSTWRYARDESMCYAELAGEIDKCRRCHRVDTYGFDHFRGSDRVIGHV